MPQAKFNVLSIIEKLRSVNNKKNLTIFKLAFKSHEAAGTPMLFPFFNGAELASLVVHMYCIVHECTVFTFLSDKNIYILVTQHNYESLV